MINPSTLEQVRGASDIIDVIGGYIPLKKAGANFQALCPFHREKTPSFNVSPQRQIFHCFGCHKGGDVFTFVREYEGVSFVEAVQRLADRASIPLELDGNAGGSGRIRQLKETLREIHEQITRRWQSTLRNEASGQVARDYLSRRGLSQEAVELFRLGYAPDSWDDTVNWSRSREYPPEVMAEAGLIVRKEEGGHYYDRFRGRLIFPIADEQGRVIGFSGRLLAEEAKAAKYLNSPETPIFTKGKVFFGLDKSKRAILDADCAIVCEGQVDLISCYVSGIENVVAPQGTALTADQARILKRYAAEVVLCFDSDPAGQAAAIRSLDSLLAAGLAIRVAVVPAPHDPDSFIRERGAVAFRGLIDSAEGFFDFLLKQLCAGHDVTTDRGRLAVAREMAVAVKKTGNSVLVDTYAQKTALRLGVAPEAVRSEFKKSGGSRPAREEPDPSPGGPDAEPEVEPLVRPSQQEFWLLKLLLLDETVVDWLSVHLDVNWLLHPGVKRCVTLRLKLQAEGTWEGVGTLLSHCQHPHDRIFVSEAAAENRQVENMGQSVKDLVLRLRNQALDRELIRLRQASSLPEFPASELEAALRRQDELRHLKRQPLEPLFN